MSNYMYYDYSTSKVAKVKEEGVEYEKANNVQSLLNVKCMQQGSSLEGRKKSYSYLMNQKKFVPIVVSVDPIEIYFPTSSSNDPECKWINYDSIKQIKYKKKTCTLIFKDNTRLECLYPNRIKENMHTIYRYLKRFNDYSQ